MRAMYAAIVEVCPTPRFLTRYLEAATALPHVVGETDGFLNVENYRSLTRDGWFLVASAWSDETALVAWRKHAEHRRAQIFGRNEMFGDYRVRVAKVVLLDSGIARQWTAGPKQRYTPPTEPASFLGTFEFWPGKHHVMPPTHVAEATDFDMFESMRLPGKCLVLCGWKGLAPALEWYDGNLTDDHPQFVLHLAEVTRDYGMRARTQAPE